LAIKHDPPVAMAIQALTWLIPPLALARRAYVDRCRWSHWRDTPREELAASSNGDTDVEEALASLIGDTDMEESTMHCLQCYIGYGCSYAGYGCSSDKCSD